MIVIPPDNTCTSPTGDVRQRKGLWCDLVKGIWHHKSVHDVVSDSDLGLVIRLLDDLDEEKTPVHQAMGLNVVENASLEKAPQKSKAHNAETVDLKKFSNDRAAYSTKNTTRRGMSGPVQSPFMFGLSNINFRNLLLLSVILCCLLKPAEATHLMKPKQALPGKCFKLIEDNGGDCPSVDHHDFQERYKELNSTCCAEFKKKWVHCQMDYDQKGKQYSQIACMEPVPVPPGFSGRIVHYDTDTPMFRLTRFSETHTTPSPSATLLPDKKTTTDKDNTEIKPESRWFHILGAFLVFAVACSVIFFIVWIVLG